MRGSDHCPCCGCEEHETTCAWVCPNPEGEPWGNGVTHDHEEG